MQHAADRAVILAAGLGTRLKWLTHNRPKALMQLGGMAAIERVLLRLAANGVRDVAVNTHHHAPILRDYLGDGSRYGVRLHFSHEPQLLDSGGGVLKALDVLPGDGPFYIYNADVLTDLPLAELMNRLPGNLGVLGLIPNPAHHPRGDFSLEHGKVVKHAHANGATFAGVSLFTPEAFAPFAVGEKFPLTAVMKPLIEQGQLGGLIHRGQWFDIGRPRDLLQARAALLKA